MKKISLFVLSFISIPAQSFFGLNLPKQEINSDVKITFKSEKTASMVSNPEYHENAKYAVKMLQDLAEQQEHRKLTMEEMALVFRVISYLFLQETEDYNKFIEVQLKNGKKLCLPYSFQLFAAMMMQNNTKERENVDQVSDEE